MKRIDKLASGKHIKSGTDIKKAVVPMMKRRGGANKVTLLREVSPGVFQAHLSKYNPATGNYDSLGYWELDAANCENFDDFARRKEK